MGCGACLRGWSKASTTSRARLRPRRCLEACLWLSGPYHPVQYPVHLVLIPSRENFSSAHTSPVSFFHRANIPMKHFFISTINQKRERMQPGGNWETEVASGQLWARTACTMSMARSLMASLREYVPITRVFPSAGKNPKTQKTPTKQFLTM